MFCKPWNRRLPALAVLLLLAAGGCGRKAEGPAPLYAVVRFENLSGDPGLDWTGLAASEVLSSTLSNAMDGIVLTPSSLARLGKALGARPAGVPGSSAQRQEAVLAGANRLISGSVEKGAGGIVVRAVDEDLTTGKAVRTLSGTGAQPLQALTALAAAFSAKAKPYATANSEALRLYSEAAEAPPAEAPGLLDRALAADPDFGEARVLLVATRLAGGDRAGASAAIAEARSHRLTDADQAGLDVSAAALSGDNAARAAALKRLTVLTPGDTTLLRAVAESETSSGRFSEAAADWKRLTGLVPSDADAWNQLGYNLAWSGNYPAAAAAHAQYAKLRPGDPNPLDSAGDVQFMYRRYAEAAKSYLAANAKAPGFERFADLYKAAWAKFRAGDKAGADKTFEEFRTARGNGNPLGIELFQADWLYRTGRRKEAAALLRARVADKESAAAWPTAYSQLAIWELAAGERAQAMKDSLAGGQPKTPVQVIVRIASMPSASPAEWSARVNGMLPGPALAGLRSLALGYALLLDGKREAATAVWQQIAASAPATDFPFRAMAEWLATGKTALALIPNHESVNEFAVLFGDL